MKPLGHTDSYISARIGRVLSSVKVKYGIHTDNVKHPFRNALCSCFANFRSVVKPCFFTFNLIGQMTTTLFHTTNIYILKSYLHGASVAACCVSISFYPYSHLR